MPFAGLLCRFAYLEFQSEKAAEEAFKQITGKKIDDREILVDFVGAKSKNVPKQEPKAVDVSALDPLKLFVTCYPRDTTAEDLKAVFPTGNVEFLIHKSTSKPIG